MEEGLNKWRGILYLWIGKKTILSRCHSIQVKIYKVNIDTVRSQHFQRWLVKENFTFVWEGKYSLIEDNNGKCGDLSCSLWCDRGIRESLGHSVNDRKQRSSSLVSMSTSSLRNWSLTVNTIPWSLSIDRMFTSCEALGGNKENQVWVLPSRSSQFRKAGRTQMLLSTIGSRPMVDQRGRGRERESGLLWARNWGWRSCVRSDS